MTPHTPVTPGLVVAGLLAVCTLSSCGSSSPDRAAAALDPPLSPHPAAETFVAAVDNPYFPLPVGREWRYVGNTDDGVERTVVTVLPETQVVDGVVVTVVHDVVHRDGRVLEDTRDWFAQDSAGNVWYFGEDTTEYDASGNADRSGSWEAGVGGGHAGIVMPARPQVGVTFRQEYLAGEAEDEATVLSLDESVTVPAGSYTGLVQTRDFTPLEPHADEHKLYARGVGVVASDALDVLDTARLVSMRG